MNDGIGHAGDFQNLTGMKDKDKDALPGRFMLKVAKSTTSCLMNSLRGRGLEGSSCPLIQIYAEFGRKFSRQEGSTSPIFPAATPLSAHA